VLPNYYLNREFGQGSAKHRPEGLGSAHFLPVWTGSPITNDIGFRECVYRRRAPLIPDFLVQTPLNAHMLLR